MLVFFKTNFSHLRRALSLSEMIWPLKSLFHMALRKKSIVSKNFNLSKIKYFCISVKQFGILSCCKPSFHNAKKLYDRFEYQYWQIFEGKEIDGSSFLDFRWFVILSIMKLVFLSQEWVFLLYQNSIQI